MNGLLEQLLEGSPFGIVVVDTNGILRILNPCARRLVTTIGNPIGKSLREAIPVVRFASDDSDDEHKQVVQHRVLARKQCFESDINNSSKNVETEAVEGRLDYFGRYYTSKKTRTVTT